MTNASVSGNLRERPSGKLWAAIAVVLVGLNLRPAIVAVSPLFEDISKDLNLTSVLAGLLVTLPVLCFGALGPLAPLLAQKFGFERSLALGLLAIIVGTALRIVPSIPALFAGTILVGAGIAIGNILLPGLIKRDFPHRLGIMSGLFSMSLAAGATLAAGITVPVAEAAGWSWNEILGAWGLLTMFTLVGWIPVVWGARGVARQPRTVGISISRDWVAWIVTALFGFQSFIFYSTTAWVPSILVAYGYDIIFAGLMLSLINLISIFPALVIPLVMGRVRRQSSLTVIVSICYIGSIIGFLLVPQWAVLWMVLLGFAQGSSLGLALTFIVLRSPDSAHATRLSGMAQSWGFLFASIGPLAAGALRDLTLGWVAPLLLLLGMAVLQAIVAYIAGKPIMVGGNAPHVTEQEGPRDDGD